MSEDSIDKGFTSRLDDLFPFVPGEKPARLDPINLGGVSTVVNDVFQYSEFPLGEKYCVVERSVSGCCVLRLSHTGGVKFFHIPAGGPENLEKQDRNLSEKVFADAIRRAAKLEGIKAEYYINGCHIGELERRRQAAVALHKYYFPDSPPPVINVIQRSDGIQTADLFEAIDLKFTNEGVLVPEGYLLKPVGEPRL